MSPVLEISLAFLRKSLKPSELSQVKHAQCESFRNETVINYKYEVADYMYFTITIITFLHVL